jgi:ClpP class serine protease
MGMTTAAATIIALGADEILMGETSELGPIDTQIGATRGASVFRQRIVQFAIVAEFGAAATGRKMNASWRT